MSKKTLVVWVACALALAWIPISAGAGKGNRAGAGNASRAEAGNENRNQGVGFCNSRIAKSMASLNQIAQGRKQSKNCEKVATSLIELAAAGCGKLHAQGKLATSSYRRDGPVMATICTTVVDICGIELPPGVCPE